GGGVLMRALTAVLIWLALLPAAGLVAPRAAADGPEDAALRVERRLLCPQCTNLRLDVCDTPICADMRAEIRDRLARGESEQQIVASFQDRFGQRVLADVPGRGFNLVLFAWVALSLLLVAAVGTAVLLRLRRSARPAAVATSEDERWLDE